MMTEGGIYLFMHSFVQLLDECFLTSINCHAPCSVLDRGGKLVVLPHPAHRLILKTHPVFEGKNQMSWQ